MDGSFLVHHRNIQNLAIELYKHKMALSPEVSEGIFDFEINDHHNLRSSVEFRQTRIMTVHYGDFSLKSFWPDRMEYASTKYKAWKPINCPCRLCKAYLPGVRFIN